MSSADRSDRAAYWGKTIRAYAVHLLTASGILFAFLAVAELFATEPDPRWVFWWLAVAGFIDAADGPLARRWKVKAYAGRIGGEVIDTIVDYLTFTFIPLLLVWRMEWVPVPTVLVVAAMGASLFGFANEKAKQSDKGFFLGFPSYWNIVAYYVGIWAVQYGPVGSYAAAGAIGVLAVLTVLPVRFIYPNRLMGRWKWWVLLGGIAWIALLLMILPIYPAVPTWIMLISFVYPAFYLGLSAYLDVQDRRVADRL